MIKALSTHIFVNQRLTAAMLDQIAHSGIDAIEIFCARQHFDYHDRSQVLEIAAVAFEVLRPAPVRPDPEWVVAAVLQQVGHLRKQPGDLVLFHAEGSGTRRSSHMPTASRPISIAKNHKDGVSSAFSDAARAAALKPPARATSPRKDRQS